MTPILATLVLPLALFQGTRKEAPPKDLIGVRIDQRLGAQVPLDLKFKDSRGKELALGDLFDGEKPVVLTLNYSSCPQLCSLQLNGLVEALQEMDWAPGKEFRVLTVSIDPRETPEVAASTKRAYLEQLEGDSLEEGWRFLVGDESSIRRLASTVGFGYRFIPERNEFAHKAALIFLDPHGKVTRYLANVVYKPTDLKFALVESGKGKVGSFLDQIFLSCFRYDSASGSYVPVAWKIMRLGGVLILLLVGGGLVGFWRLERRRAARRLEQGSC